MNILIATPTYENIMPDTYRSVSKVVKKTFYETGWWPEWDFIRGYTVDNARNHIAKKALSGYDSVLMVDNDVILPEDALLNLLEHDEDVAMGYYVHRSSTGGRIESTNVCKLGENNFTKQYTRAELRALRDAGEHKVRIHGGGLGCALVKTSVFERISWPFFRWYIYGDGHGTLSEDLYFCVKCEKAGIPIYVDTRVHCKHCIRHFEDAD